MLAVFEREGLCGETIEREGLRGTPGAALRRLLVELARDRHKSCAPLRPVRQHRPGARPQHDERALDVTDDRRRHRAGQHRRPRRLRHADDAVLVECAAQPDLRGARLLRRRTASTSLSRCRSSPPTSSSSTTPILATTIERHQTIMENTCS